MINEKGLIYLDENVREYFCGEERPMTLYRYMDRKYLKNNQLRFSKPETWNDPYEKLFLESTYLFPEGQIEYPLLNRVFGLCFTTESSSEAAWKVYDCATKFSLKTGIFIDMLKEYTRDFEIYIGKVNYKSQTSLERESIKRLTGLSENDFTSNEAWVRLLFLKRRAFKYEEEIRVILVPKKAISEDAIFLDFGPMKDLFHHVEIAPSLPSLFFSGFSEEFVRKDLINLGFSADQISVSRLYAKAGKRNLRISRTE